MRTLKESLLAEAAAEAAAHTATKDAVAQLQKQVAAMSTTADAARAQLQAHSISAQQRTAQFERQKAELEVRSLHRSCALRGSWGPAPNVPFVRGGALTGLCCRRRRRRLRMT